MKKVKVLFVCLGNICRSPTAEGVFRKKVSDAGLEETIEIDSAGTSGWHIGEPPDQRAVAAAKARGYDLAPLRGRQLVADDFRIYDYILVMDRENLANSKAIAPPEFSGCLRLLLAFSSQSHYSEVPDPYYGGDQGFETVLDLLEDSCDGLLKEIERDSL
ncbi:Low molecular weight phosphotyrosine protein phosphatase [Teredinibacter turnerae T7901]|uniref:protein-tyrosine-phosphatase n=1 Tax=Teredinibacter turnerae (strain ATCC 39867 / T7901) TaxID=377629 RepID=C5BL27_TERTT|nr:low molecular weight protein-tyrosine-phosphatase [Teredinibacter turnerae]ACR10970.1 Low molecular weight phosphotyrosine protein phosphatase [Teredinibacter turnerae T7901]